MIGFLLENIDRLCPRDSASTPPGDTSTWAEVSRLVIFRKSAVRRSYKTKLLLSLPTAFAGGRPGCEKALAAGVAIFFEV